MPHALVPLNHLPGLLLGLGVNPTRRDGDNLIGKPPRLLRTARAPLALGRVLILLATTHAVPRGDILRCLQHWHQTVARGLDGRLLQQRRDVDGDAARGVVARHALDAAGHADVDLPDKDGVGDVRQRLQTAGALAVHGVEGGGVGEAGGVEGHAAGFGEAQLRQDVADHGVVDVAGLDVGALHGGLHDLLSLLVRGDGAERMKGTGMRSSSG